MYLRKLGEGGCGTVALVLDKVRNLNTSRAHFISLNSTNWEVVFLVTIFYVISSILVHSEGICSEENRQSQRQHDLQNESSDSHLE